MESQALNYLSNSFLSLSRECSMLRNRAKRSLELSSSINVLLNESMVQEIAIL
jgi:hypothetical protein